MKRTRRTVVAATVLGVALSFAVVRVAVALLGDLSGDGLVTPLDAQQVLEAIVGRRVLTPAQLADADVDGDGDVDVADAQLIRQFADHTLGGFPIRVPENSGPIAITRDGRVVAAVNPDSNTVTFLTTATDSVLAEVPVGREPIGVAFSRDGSRAYVADARDAQLSVVDTETFTVVGAIPVGVEPFGVVVNFRGDRAYVSNFASATVSVIDLHDETVTRQIPVPDKPQGLAVSADSRRIYVTHLNGGQLSVIDANTFAVTSIPLAEVPFDEFNTTQPAGKPNRMKGITIHPTRAEAWFPHILSNSGNFVETLFNTTIFPAVGILDTGSNTLSRRVTLFAGLATVVSNPEAVAFAPDGAQAFVVSAASNDLTIVNVQTRQETGLVRDVGDNPRGIVVHPDGTRAYVFNRLTPAVSIVDLVGRRLLASVPSSVDLLAPNIANGRRLFFTSAPPEVAQDRFFGCEACHFDGRDDGQTWFFTNGPRQTLSLAGTTAHTGLLHHNGDRKDVQDFRFTFTRLQNGTGLSEDQLNDLADFVNTKIRFPENPFLNGDLSRTPAARRGRRVFGAASCAGCHAGAFLTDATGHDDPAHPLLHDVGTFNPGTLTQDEIDKTRDQDGIAAGTVRPAGHFESTFLTGVWGTAPFLHDGRSGTLRDVLTTDNPGDRHGVTSHLTPAQIDDLIAYLQQADVTQARVEITLPRDAVRVARLGEVSGVVLPDVQSVQVLVNGAGPIPATVAAGRFTAVVPPGLVPAVPRGTHFDVTALATTTDGEPGRDDVEVEANFGAAPDVALSTVDASPALIPSDGVSTSLITVTPRNALGLAGSGLSIQVQTTLGTLGAVQDAGDGTYVAVLTAAAAPGIATVSARQAGGPLFTDTALVRFASGVVDAAASEVSVSPGSIEASVIARATVTVIPRNALGIDLGPGQTVGVTVDRGTVGAVTDVGEGVYTAVYAPPTTTGIATFRATVNGVLLNAAPALTLSPDRTAPAPADLGRVTFATPAAGQSRTTGGAGAVEPSSTVRLQNLTTFAIVNTPGASDGSFSTNVPVLSNQIICITVIDAANNASPAACTVPFPVNIPAVRGVVRTARAGGGFTAVGGALVELDVANLTDAQNPGFSPVFAGGHFLTARTAGDGSFEILLPAGFMPDPNLAVVTGPDANLDGLVDTIGNFALVNDVTRTVLVDELSTTLVFLIGFNDTLLNVPVRFPASNFTPAERTAIENTLRPATTGIDFLANDPLQAIADDVFFDAARDFLDLTAYETFRMAAESPGTGAPPVVVRGRLTVPAAGGARALAGVAVDLATLSFTCPSVPPMPPPPICVAPIAGANGVTNAAGEYSLTLPGFIVPGATAVVVAIGDLTYNGVALPGPFDSSQSVFSLASFVTDPAVNVDVDLAGRIAMSLIGNAGVPIENFNPVEMDQLVALVRTRLATRVLTLANRRLRDVFVDAFNAMSADAQVVALLASIRDPESGDNSHVTANPLMLQADGVSVSTITVEPLDQTAQRVGPGLLVELSTTLGTITTPALDNHDGTYTAFLRAPTTPGVARVTARIEGNDLTERPTITFTPDVTAPAAPDGGRVVFVGVGGGSTTVIGLPGAAEAGSQVTVVNVTRGTSVTVRASDDGSFRADILGSAGDSLTVRADDAASHMSAVTPILVNAGLTLPAIANPSAVPAGVTPVLAPLGAGGLGAAVPTGFTFVGGFTLELADQTATAALDVLAATSAPVPAGRQLLLVQAIDLPGSTELRVVAPALAAGGVLFPLRGAAYPGVRTGGRYAYLAANAAQAFVFGVLTGSRGPIEGVHMTLDSSPFTDLSRPDGRYLLAGPLGGGQTVSAALFAHGTPQTVTARLPFAGANVACDFTLSTRATVSFAFTGRFAGVGQVARRMALTPSGDKLLVAENLRGDFVILDTASLTQTSLIDDSGTLADLSVGPNGFAAFLAFTNRVRDFTIGIEEPGRAIISVRTPRRIAVTPNGDTALVASSMDGVEGDALPDAIFPVDTFTNRVEPAISIDADPAAIVVNRAGTRAYVVSRTRGTLGVIDVPGRAVLRTVTLGGAPVDVAVNASGTELYVADAVANTVAVLNAAAAEDATPGNELLATIPVGQGPSALALAPGNARLLVAEQQDDTVSVIDPATRAVVSVWATVDLPAHVLVHPSGKTAYVLDSQTRRGVLEVPLARTDTTAPTVLDVGPQDRVGSVLQDSPVEIIFSEKMDASTVTPANVQVRDAGGAVLAGTLVATGEGVAAVFTPAAGLRYALNSTLRVGLGAGLRDVAGLPLAPVERVVPTFAMRLPDPRLISLDLSSAGVSATGMPGGVHGGSLVEITNLSTGVVFRRTAATDGSFSLALTGLDTDGYRLVTSVFGGRARTDPITLHPNFTIRLPDASRVSYQPGPAGTLLAVGGAGAVDPQSSRIRIRNLTSGQNFDTMTVGADGSFSVAIFARTADSLDLLSTILGAITLDAVPLPSPNLAAPVIDFLTPDRFVFGNPVTLTVVGRNFGTVPGNMRLEVGGAIRTDFTVDVVSGGSGQQAILVSLPVGADSGSVRVTVGGQASNSVDYSAETAPNTSPFAEEVIASSTLTDPSAALGQSDASFTDLGPGGSITLRLGSTVEDGPGNDLQVFEDTSDGEDCYDVSVSASSVGPFDALGRFCGTAFVNLAGHDPIRFVRLVDANDGGIAARIGGVFAIRVKLAVQIMLLTPEHTGGLQPDVMATIGQGDTFACPKETKMFSVSVSPPPEGGGGYGGGCSDSIGWGVGGGGMIDPPTGGSTTFTAPDAGGSQTVIAVHVIRSGNCSTTGADSKTVKVDTIKVMSVEWVAKDRPLTANDHPLGTVGMKIFADKDTPGDGTDSRTVKVRATIAPVHAMVPVAFKTFDVDDPDTDMTVDPNGASGSDNRGASVVPPATQNTDASGVAEVEFQVSRNPGDNYRIAAACKADEFTMPTMLDNNTVTPDDAAVAGFPGALTPMLTVWRHLWLESDTMPAITNALNELTSTVNDIVGMGTALTEVKTVGILGDPAPSTDLDAAAPSNGRFENGTLLLGTGATQKTITPLTASGQRRVTFPATSLAGLAFAARDNDIILLPGRMSGTITEVVKNGTDFDWTLNITAHNETPIDWPDFVGGTLTVGEGVDMPITAVDSATNKVTTSAMSIPLTVRDDDDLTLLPFMPAAVAPILVNAYRDVYMVAQLAPSGNNTLLTVKLNLLPDEMDTIKHIDNDSNAADDYWVAYVEWIHQFHVAQDYDQNNESTPDLGSGRGWGGGTSCATALETARDSFNNGPSAGQYPGFGYATFIDLGWRTTAHEIGHEFGLDHNNGGLMSFAEAPAATSQHFSPGDQVLLRRRVRSPGR